jgi:flavin reductase (DIM6/NTAB) family NADH-FMN oxidoreductase RutF
MSTLLDTCKPETKQNLKMNKREFKLEGMDITKLSWILSNGQMVMLTSCNADKSINGIIPISWMMPTSHQPLLITASVGHGGKETGDFAYRVSYSLINETKEFGLNVPTSDLMESMIKAGTTHSDEVDKFSECKFTPMPSKHISAPLIANCFMNIECKVLDQFRTGDHTVFVAEPLIVYVDDDVIVEGRFNEKYLDKSNQAHLTEAITLLNMW